MYVLSHVSTPRMFAVHISCLWSLKTFTSTATTPVPELKLTVEVGDRTANGLMEETVTYSMDDITLSNR